MVHVRKIQTRREIRDFVMLPFQLYKEDSSWVPPLIHEMKNLLRGKNNSLFKAGPHEAVVAYKDGAPQGRLLVGINEELNQYKGIREGYIALYECMEDEEVSSALLQFAEEFLKSYGIEKVKGPLSVPGGDDFRGFIIDNFKDPTYVMNTYNKKYYNDQFLKAGFIKYFDCYAYEGEFTMEDKERLEKLVPYAMKRYGYTVEPLNLNDVENEMKDIKKIIEEAMPKDWDDFMPPTEEEIRMIKKQLVPFADPDFIYIARDKERNPIGFDIALPDYNQVLARMKGRYVPLGFLKFLYFRKKIDALRIFVLFVTPEYRKKGVTAAIYYEGLKKGIARGFRKVEGSTVWEYNRPMQNDAFGFTGDPYKTYRIYQKEI